MIDNESDLEFYTFVTSVFIILGIYDYHNTYTNGWYVLWYVGWLLWCLYMAGQYRVVHTTDGIRVEER